MVDFDTKTDGFWSRFLLANRLICLREKGLIQKMRYRLSKRFFVKFGMTEGFDTNSQKGVDEKKALLFDKNQGGKPTPLFITRIKGKD